ncbi:MAG TPA: quinolinate synthase NadA [Myxococcota bacterium]|nr:quinolinate synthase NadA [Myxococcota bacterium]
MATSLAPRSDPLPDDLEEAIRRLKRERDAVLLAHYYQEDAVQDLADHVGDSLALARVAQRVDRRVICFCGVHFMAETAKILNPERRVVVPDLAAGCSLADGCPAEAFARFVAEHPGAVVVSYINCSAEVKALSDVICTSSNAVEIVRHFADRPVIFAPDRHLGRWVAQQAGRPDLIVWPGACIVHEQFNAKALAQLRVKHPEAEVLSHPECEEAVLAQSDFIGSTKKIIDRAIASPARTLIIGTEDGVFHQIRRRVPDKELIQIPGMDESCSCNRCPYMRLNTLEKLYLCLRDLAPEVTVPEPVRLRALRPLERMLELSGPG